MSVRSIFRSFSRTLDLAGNEQRRALEAYYASRDNLELSIQHAIRGLLSINWINIIDLDDDPDALCDLRVEVALNGVLDAHR
jgi:hypothetical protein